MATSSLHGHKIICAASIPAVDIVRVHAKLVRSLRGHGLRQRHLSLFGGATGRQGNANSRRDGARFRQSVEALPGGSPPPPPPSSYTWLTASEEPDDRNPQRQRFARIALLLSAGFVVCLAVVNTLENAASWEEDTESAAVSIIIPTLNEEAKIAAAVEHLLAMSPAPAEVIVCDGGSTDRTCEEAASAGAKVVEAGRGRAIQMNAGAAEAKGSLLCFVHADSSPPGELVGIVRQYLADRRTVMGGFRVLIRHEGRTLRWMSFHQFIKTFYAPLLFRPLSFARGLRAMFGDQSLFCRASDFGAVGGYDESLPIMEDLDLLMRLHRRGLPADEKKKAADSNPGESAHKNAFEAALAASPVSEKSGGMTRPVVTGDMLGAVKMTEEEKLKHSLFEPGRHDKPFEPELTLGETIRKVQRASDLQDDKKNSGLAASRTSILSKPSTGVGASTATSSELPSSSSERGPPRKLWRGRRAGAGCRGRIRMVLRPHSVTSGRRLAAWGNLRGTWIHFRIATHWYFGGSAARLRKLYDELYTDKYR